MALPFSQEHTGHISGGDPLLTQDREHNVRVILADAFAQGKSLRGRGPYRRRARCVDERAMHGVHHIFGLLRSAGADAQPVCELLQGAGAYAQPVRELLQGAVRFRKGGLEAEDPLFLRISRRRAAGQTGHGLSANIGFKAGMLPAAEAAQKDISPLVGTAAQVVFREDIVLQVNDLLAAIRYGDAPQREMMAAHRCIHIDLQMIMKRKQFHVQHSTSCSTMRMISL